MFTPKLKKPAGMPGDVSSPLAKVLIQRKLGMGKLPVPGRFPRLEGNAPRGIRVDQPKGLPDLL